MVLMICKDELKYALVENGAQFAIINGVMLMLGLFVLNLAIQTQVQSVVDS